MRWPGRYACAMLLAATALAAGCAAQTRDVSLDITGSCQAGQLDDVTVISVELWGHDADGAICALGRRCLYDVSPQSVSDIATAIAAVQQPLLDISDDAANTIAVIGHSGSCFAGDDHLACGRADVADITSDGHLTVAMSCGNCPVEEAPFCP